MEKTLKKYFALFALPGVVNASAYAGHTIDIAPSAGVGSSVIFESQSSENINVVCGGNSFSVGGVSSGTIRVGGDTSVRSEAHFKGANIWCENILTSKTVVNGTEAGATITIDSACNSYIKDDVSAEAENSDITINGNYYGYMYYGDTLGHGGSSAIIVNGKNSKVSIGASKIVLGGHAYVDIDRSNTLDGQYMTGESLSLKGSQDVYLVPAELLGVGYDKRLQNPTSEAAWNELISAAAGDANIKICDVSSYFAKQYVDGSATPYVVRKINGMVYVYWNFENTAAARSYIKDVVNGADSNLKETLIRYNNNLFNGSAGSLIQVTNPSASIQSSGLFMQWASGVPSYKEPSSDTSGAMFQIESKNYEKRYEIISHMLVTLPWGDNYISNSKVALEQLKGIVVEDSILNGEDIIEYIVDCSILEADNGQYNVDSNIIKHGDGTKNYTKVAVDNNGGSGAAYDYRVPDGSIPGTERIDGGIIIATGNVILNHDFEGLIIAGGDIRIEGNATLTTNPNTLETLILEKEDFLDESIPREPEAFKRYFYAYKSVAMEEDSREEIKIENVDYKDLVKFDNWRKYED